MGYKIDLTGQTFGRLTVLEFAGNHPKKGGALWKCICSCVDKTVVIIQGQHLKNGETKSCRCWNREKLKEANERHLIGKKFNLLTVTKKIGQNKHRSMVWEVLCDCGKITTATTGILTTDQKKSCGCLKLTTSYMNSYKHGMIGSTEYLSWQNMKARCLRPNGEKYEKYGGAGVFICSALKEPFESFLEVMGFKLTPDYTIDRYPNKKGSYTCGKCPECIANNWPLNVRWATKKQQSANLTNNIHYTYNGETHIQAEWNRIFGLKGSSLISYMKRHTFEEAYRHYMDRLAKISLTS